MKTHTKIEAVAALKALRGFIGQAQRNAICDACRGEEKQFFFDKLCELAGIVSAMPQTYEQQGQGDAAIVSLHYFAGGQANWYITEKDKGCPTDSPEDFQSQAFGLADLYNDGGELGYISIPEILANGGELDLYFKPCTLGELKAERAKQNARLDRSGQSAMRAMQPTSENRRVRFTANLNALLELIAKKAKAQFDYNEQTNIPENIIQPDESIPLAINHGIVATMSQINEYAIEPTIELAASLLEDVNARSEAAALRANLQPVTA